jgi:hypothetical protein
VRRPIIGALALSISFIAIGCGPIRYVGQVSRRASAALDEARLQKADVLAPYELTMATAYELKAREVAGLGRFELAIAYGRRASEMAEKASYLARSRAKYLQQRAAARAIREGGNAP